MNTEIRDTIAAIQTALKEYTSADTTADITSALIDRMIEDEKYAEHVEVLTVMKGMVEDGHDIDDIAAFASENLEQEVFDSMMEDMQEMEHEIYEELQEIEENSQSHIHDVEEELDTKLNEKETAKENDATLDNSGKSNEISGDSLSAEQKIGLDESYIANAASKNGDAIKDQDTKAEVVSDMSSAVSDSIKNMPSGKSGRSQGIER